VNRDWTQRPLQPAGMDPLEQEIRNLLADEAVRQRYNGLARKIRAGHDETPKIMVAIETIKTVMASVGRLSANEELLK
jgi:hypothetical protein